MSPDERGPAHRAGSATRPRVPFAEGAQQAEAAGEHHVAVGSRELERQLAAGEQLAARPRHDERQAQRVACGRSGGQHGAVPVVGAYLGALEVAGEPAAQAQLEPGSVEARGVVLEHPGDAPAQRQQADGVAVADVDQDGVADTVGQGAVERRRAGVGDQRRRVAGKGRRGSGGRP